MARGLFLRWWLFSIKYEASTSPSERKQLSQAMQRYTIEEYLAVPLYINPFVHAVGPKVVGDLKFYYATPQAPISTHGSIGKSKQNKTRNACPLICVTDAAFQERTACQAPRCCFPEGAGVEEPPA